MKPCSGRWSLRRWRLWIFQACSALAATATSVPSRPAAPKMTTASRSSPCPALREASRLGLVSVHLQATCSEDADSLSVRLNHTNKKKHIPSQLPHSCAPCSSIFNLRLSASLFFQPLMISLLRLSLSLVCVYVFEP